MYICDECGTLFEEPKVIRENMGEFWGSPAYEYWDVCPACNSSDWSSVPEEDDDL